VVELDPAVFEHISETVKAALAAGEPVISVVEGRTAAARRSHRPGDRALQLPRRAHRSGTKIEHIAVLVYQSQLARAAIDLISQTTTSTRPKVYARLDPTTYSEVNVTKDQIPRRQHHPTRLAPRIGNTASHRPTGHPDQTAVWIREPFKPNYSYGYLLLTNPPKTVLSLRHQIAGICAKPRGHLNSCP